MPGGGDIVVGGVRETDDGRGPFVLGAAEGKGPVKGELEGDGASVAGGAHADTAWEGRGGETEFVSHVS